MIADLFGLALAWMGWCALHSGLIAPGVTRWFRGHLGEYYAFFRLGYNLLALLTLVPLLLWSEAMPYPPFLVWRWPYTVLAGVLWLAAAVLAVGGLRTYALGEFGGLTQIRRWREGQGDDTEPRALSRGGILGVVRHPWYLAGLIVLWTRNLAPQDLVTSVLLSVYLVLGAHWEERKLITEFGEVYRHYQRQVPMLLPRLRRRRRR